MRVRVRARVRARVRVRVRVRVKVRVRVRVRIRVSSTATVEPVESCDGDRTAAGGLADVLDTSASGEEAIESQLQRPLCAQPG